MRTKSKDSLAEIARRRGVSRSAVSKRLRHIGKGRDTYADLATERAKLAAAQRRRIETAERVRRGELVEKSAVEAGHAEMREIIRNDLIGTLPLRLASGLAGRSWSAAEVRAAVLAAVREIIQSWAKGSIPVQGVEP